MQSNDEFYIKKINPLKFQRWPFYAAVALSVVGISNSEFFQETSQVVVTQTQEIITQTTENLGNVIDDLFNGGQSSKVAIAVGSAEGTRTTDGGFTEAYNGHIDPGNAASNLGSFSYQHGASSPEEADSKQLERLKNQLRETLTEEEIASLSTKEILNTVDLLNQAPLAGYDFPKLLNEAKAQGLSGNDAILSARSKAFIDPNTGTLDAPGLTDVEADQSRRMSMIDAALEGMGQ